ncbi:hypothetical protein C8J57DRAFT_1250778 [Mycena rebaudengoi]|nr:hypothetical protein C8J57DRAFT_1250778 [Mycena rebaudengoi]
MNDRDSGAAVDGEGRVGKVVNNGHAQATNCDGRMDAYLARNEGRRSKGGWDGRKMRPDTAPIWKITGLVRPMTNRRSNSFGNFRCPDATPWAQSRPRILPLSAETPSNARKGNKPVGKRCPSTDNRPVLATRPRGHSSPCDETVVPGETSTIGYAAAPYPWVCGSMTANEIRRRKMEETREASETGTSLRGMGKHTTRCHAWRTTQWKQTRAHVTNGPRHVGTRAPRRYTFQNTGKHYTLSHFDFDIAQKSHRGGPHFDFETTTTSQNIATDTSKLPGHHPDVDLGVSKIKGGQIAFWKCVATYATLKPTCALAHDVDGEHTT